MLWVQEDRGAEAYEDIMSSPEAPSLGVSPNLLANSNDYHPEAVVPSEEIAALVGFLLFLPCSSSSVF
jgi:hypothetical protein